MKKIFILVMFTLSLSARSFGQDIEREDMLPLFKFLSAKNWDSAFIKANEIIKNFPDDSSDFKALANYASILSAAGKVSNDRMTYKELREIIFPFLGKRLLMPVHPTTTDTLKIAYNTNMLKENPSGIKGSSMTVNADGQTILTFEDFEFSNSILIKEYDKKNTTCGGKLFKVEINRYQDKIWIMRMLMIDATIRKI